MKERRQKATPLIVQIGESQFVMFTRTPGARQGTETWQLCRKGSYSDSEHVGLQGQHRSAGFWVGKRTGGMGVDIADPCAPTVEPLKGGVDSEVVGLRILSFPHPHSLPVH